MQRRTIHPSNAHPSLGTVPLICALFLAFLPLAYSDDLLDAYGAAAGLKQVSAWWLPAIDAVLVLAIAALGWLSGYRSGATRLRLWLLVAGGALTCGIDLMPSFSLRTVRGFAIEVAEMAAYAIALALIVAGITGTKPHSRQNGLSYAWPLVGGTLTAYFAAGVWQAFSDNCQLHNIEREYFAQVSQVIPLLLVAVGFEARHFRRHSQHAIGRAVAVVTVVVLGLGEALALSALTVPDNPVATGGVPRCASDPLLWHEYTAFVISVHACAIALMILIWALGARPESERDHATGVTAVRAARARARRSRPASAILPRARTSLGSTPGRATSGGLMALVSFLAGVATARALRRRPGP